MTYHKIYNTLFISIAFLSLVGCTPPLDMKSPIPQTHSSTPYIQDSQSKPSSQNLALYKQTMRKIGGQIQQDENYQRIAFANAEEKAWFRSLSYRLWDRQITAEEFLDEGLSKYPDHQYEFDFIIKAFDDL